MVRQPSCRRGVLRSLFTYWHEDGMRALVLHDSIHYELKMVWVTRDARWDLVSCTPKPPDNWVLASLFARACSMAAAVGWVVTSVEQP